MRINVAAAMQALALLFLSCPAAVAQFRFVPHADKMTDADRSFIITFAIERGSSQRTPSLMWRCLDDGLNIVYSFDKYFSGDSDDEVRVQWRFDGGQASEPIYWGLMQGQESAYIPVELVLHFTKTARSARTVVLRAIDSDGETVTDTFSLSGLSTALPKLSCTR